MQPTNARRVSGGSNQSRFDRTCEEILRSNSRGFLARVAEDLEVSSMSVHQVLHGKATSSRIAAAIVRIWPQFLKDKAKGVKRAA